MRQMVLEKGHFRALLVLTSVEVVFNKTGELILPTRKESRRGNRGSGTEAFKLHSAQTAKLIARARDLLIAENSLKLTDFLQHLNLQNENTSTLLAIELYS